MTTPHLAVLAGDGKPDDPVAVIRRSIEAGLPFPAIDYRVRQRFPRITPAEVVAAYREAGRLLLAEAQAIEAAAEEAP